LVVLGWTLVYVEWPTLDRLFLRFAGADKLVHFIAGAGLWAVAFWTQRWVLGASAQRARALIATTVTVALVFGDEYSQSFFSERTLDWMDPLSGLAGMAFAIVCGGLFRPPAGMMVAAASLCVVAFTARASYVENHYFFEGILLERAGQYEQAYERYRRGLERPHPPAGLYNNIAWLCLNALNRDYESALKWARRGVELAPEDPNVRDTLAWAYYKNGDLAAAWEHVLQAVEAAPEHAVIQDHMRIIRLSLNETSESGP
jgi:tetratricopeptide (TPR) repeat protein